MTDVGGQITSDKRNVFTYAFSVWTLVVSRQTFAGGSVSLSFTVRVGAAGFAPVAHCQQQTQQQQTVSDYQTSHTVKTLCSGEYNVRHLTEQTENHFGFQPLILFSELKRSFQTAGYLDRGLNRQTFRPAESSTYGVIQAPVCVNDDWRGGQ